MKNLLSLINKRIKNFIKLAPAIKYALRVRKKSKDGASIFFHPVVIYKVIFRLFSAPFFRLSNLFTPGEYSFEKKLNNLIESKISDETINNRRFFDFDLFKIYVPNFKNAEKVILNDFREVYLDNVYGKHFFLGKPINNNDVILDLGANIGGFSLWACNQANNVKCYAVEPHPSILKEFKANIKLNNLENNIFTIDKCISSNNEKLKMDFNEEVFTMTRISSEDGSLEVDAVTIDFLVNDLEIDELDLIKFDVEGAERMAIMGARETLVKHKPKLALSGYHLVDDVYFLIDLILEIQPEYQIIVGSNMHIYAF